jgi:hypothetical protein
MIELPNSPGVYDLLGLNLCRRGVIAREANSIRTMVTA